MAHYYLIQIESEPINLDNEKTYDDFSYNDYLTSRVDYIDSVSKEVKKKAVGYFKNVLPADCFDTSEDGVITLIKEPIEFGEEHIANIKEIANKLTLNSLTNFCNMSMYELKVAMCENQFYTDMVCYEDDYMTFTEWILSTLHHKVGTKYYIGSVFDFHN